MNFETKLASLEVHFRKGMFDQTRVLLSADPQRGCSADAILMMTTSYFEAINEFLTGEESHNNSKAFFRAGFRAVFPAMVNDVLSQGHPDSMVNEVIDALYDEIRNGLFHTAATRSRVRISWSQASAVVFQFGDPAAAISVQPARYARCIENHFDEYVTDLKACAPGSVERLHFEVAFDRRMGTIPRSGSSPALLVSGQKLETKTS